MLSGDEAPKPHTGVRCVSRTSATNRIAIAALIGVALAALLGTLHATTPTPAPESTAASAPGTPHPVHVRRPDVPHLRDHRPSEVDQSLEPIASEVAPAAEGADVNLQKKMES
jgi:hypothetical protein